MNTGQFNKSPFNYLFLGLLFVYFVYKFCTIIFAVFSIHKH